MTAIPHWLRPESIAARKRQSEAALRRRKQLLPNVAALLVKGMTLRAIARMLGVGSTSVLRICEENGLKYAKSKGKFVTDQDWQVADAAGLTAAEREAASRYGIAETRFAWLKSCPKFTIEGGRK